MAGQDGMGGDRRVGVIMGDLTNPFYVELADGVFSILTACDFVPVLSDSRDDPKREADLIADVIGQGAEGLIATVTRDSASLLGTSVPTVGIGPADRHLPHVSVDNVLGAELAVGHLIERGYRRIGTLLDDLGLTPVSDRYDGYLRALADGDLEANTDLAVICPGGLPGTAREGADQLLDAGVDAIFAINDIMALVAIEAIRARGLRVAADVGVAGYDDTSLAKDNDMTSISATTYILGREAAKMLVSLIRNPETQFAPVLLAPRLVVRGSSAGRT